ncbi:MAG: polysaccharide deacetylase family protein [Gemmatimonadota bacterium]
MSARSLIKRLAESATTTLGVVRASERANRHGVAVLSYHNIVPEGEASIGDVSLHLPVRTFREHLDCLQAHYRVVGLDRLGDPHDGTAPRVAITFDDAYCGAVVTGLAELARRRLPATVFVSAGLLDRRSFWWDRLSDEEGRIPIGRRDHALWHLAGADQAVREWMADEGMREREIPEHALSATRAELSSAIAVSDVTIGAHGWDHLNMAALSAAQLAQECAKPAESLRGDWTSYRPWVAYPYGLSSDTVVAAAADHYRLGFRIDGGLARVEEIADRPLAVARINVPAGLSARGLRLRVSGLRT